ncbi:MAG: peroxidase-related enzyme [Pseudomonadota bacterium]
MTFLPSMPDDAHVPHLFARWPHIYKVYQVASTAIMRGPSPLSEAQREALGAFVSSTNSCSYCFGSHAETARLFGVDPDLLEALIADVDTAPIDEKERPLFRYARKLSLEPSRMVQADADAIYDAGWDEDALHSVVAVVCGFSFINRFVLGLGIDANQQNPALLGAERHGVSYTPMVPIPALEFAETVEEAMSLAPPNFEKMASRAKK